jgi:hypothetical protein
MVCWAKAMTERSCVSSAALRARPGACARWCALAQPCQQTQAELPANDRSGLHGTLYWLFEMIDARADNILNRRRELDPCVSSPADTAVGAGQESALVQGVGDPFNE